MLNNKKTIHLVPEIIIATTLLNTYEFEKFLSLDENALEILHNMTITIKDCMQTQQELNEKSSLAFIFIGDNTEQDFFRTLNQNLSAQFEDKGSGHYGLNKNLITDIEKFCQENEGFDIDSHFKNFLSKLNTITKSRTKMNYSRAVLSELALLPSKPHMKNDVAPF